MYLKKICSTVLLLAIFFVPFTNTAHALIALPPGIPTASNVLFIPGFEGSRLYTESNIGGIDQLWEPNSGNADVRQLFLNENGESIDPDIFTSDIIDKGNIIPILLPNVYKSFIDTMNDLVANNVIHKWKALPYDWRFSVDYIVENGFIDDGQLTYIKPLPKGELPYMIKQVEDLAFESANGKVTIVTHSNGGLVAKALVRKLVQMKEETGFDGIDKIERIIMVAAPQLGTPSATAVLLHGEGMEISAGLILNKKTAREFGENSPGAYGLLPSEKYFEVVAEPEIVFENSVTKVSNLLTSYGSFIDDFNKRNQFLLAGIDGRSKPSISDLETPAVLNEELLNQTAELHGSLDNLSFPESMDVHYVAGWGIPTIKTIGYKSKERCIGIISNECITEEFLDYYPIFTLDGDKQVVSPSAMYGNNGYRYYINLEDYSKENKRTNHVNIFENESLLEFIVNTLNEEDSLPTYFSTEKPASPGNMVLSMHSPMSLSVRDSEGRHTGISESSTEDFTVIDEEIPGSFYLEFGDNKYIGLPTNQNYEVEMIGEGYGEFTFIQEIFSNDQSQEKVVFSNIPAMPDIKATVEIQNGISVESLSIDIDQDGVIDEVVKPGEVGPLELLEIIREKIISLNLSKKLENRLLKKIDRLEKKFTNGKIKNLEKRINVFTHKLSLKNKKLKQKHPRLRKIKRKERKELVALFEEFLDTVR